MNNRIIYLVLFVISVLVSLTVKMQREALWGIAASLDIILGSMLSYSYVIGLVACYVTFANTMTTAKLNKAVLGISCGALLYEVNQAFIDTMHFDWNDVIATILAYLTLTLIQFLRPVNAEADQPSVMHSH
ncbi:hypothetical protein [Alteromonas gilva]|uniref:Uncharacterized protein n=1 Tax=Alteromonas gilva TaxID=2987522 RepID=A0ABT5L5Y7_9ALTE|nr:hypothetical protein [Alteromonas gilva]MDC8831896.1 hypothetical protein [Alteromonas gilva]